MENETETKQITILEKKLSRVRTVALAGIGLITILGTYFLADTRNELIKIAPLVENLERSYAKSYSLMQSNRFDEARSVASNYFDSVRGVSK